MGHTRLKRKKKGWATQKVRAQRGGDFNLMAPKKQDLQVIDTFHDFWKMEKGELLNLDIANPLILNIIKWLLLNYCVFALGITPTRPLLQVAPTNNFNFNPYTTAPKGGDLLYKSKLALSKIEVTGRNYVKVPEAVIWGRAAVNLHANFIALCQVLIPGTNPTALHQSIIYIVCDSGPANFRNFGIDSVAAAIQIRAAEAAAAAAAAGVAPDPVATDPDMLTARISARVSIAGAIAALAQAISIGAAQAGQILDHIKNKFVDDIVSALSDVSKTKIGSKASKAISPQKMSRVIGLIYIAPIIIINARDIVAANIAAADIPATAAANAAAIQGVIENSLQLAALDQLPPHAGDVDTLYDAILTDVNVKLVGTAIQPFDDTNSDVIKAYVLPNMCHIIDPATTLIAATILAMWAATPDALSQIMAVTTAMAPHNRSPVTNTRYGYFGLPFSCNRLN